MKIGKLSNRDLQHLVLDRLPKSNRFVTSGPAVGQDCAAIRFGDGQVILSTDPITGASSDIGRLAVMVNVNDIAACGIRPTALLLTIIAPPDCTTDELGLVIDQAAATAEKMNVSIVGGHTEVSDAVNRMVISSTAIGFTYGNQIIRSCDAIAGDTLIMTKTAGLEGTVILAADQAERLQEHLSAEEFLEARELFDQISVLEEGSCGADLGVHAMHDATEGGILGAVWEIAEASGVGCIVEADKIPVHPLTEKICRILELDALRLIASGSMIMATSDPEILVTELTVRGINSKIIGRLTENRDRILMLEGKELELPPPGSDELYKML